MDLSCFLTYLSFSLICLIPNKAGKVSTQTEWPYSVLSSLWRCSICGHSGVYRALGRKQAELSGAWCPFFHFPPQNALGLQFFFASYPTTREVSGAWSRKGQLSLYWLLACSSGWREALREKRHAQGHNTTIPASVREFEHHFPPTLLPRP